MDAVIFNGTCLASSVQYVCGERNSASGVITKALETRQKCSFSIDAILSTRHREPGQISMEVYQRSKYPVPLAPQLWLPSGYSTHSLPSTHHYSGLHPNDIQNPNGFSGSCDKLMSRSYVRRTCRRIRTIFTDEQLKKLEEVFSKQHYMTGTEKVLLASALRLSETQVKVWFQNRRTRWRKTQEDKGATSENCNELDQRSSPRKDGFISVDEGHVHIED